MKRLAALVFMLLTLCTAAQAAEYTVDPNGNGDFTSLTEAVVAANDGDVLILLGGVYDNTKETFPIQVDKSVTICAAEGQTPVIDSPRLVNALDLYADGIRISGLQFDFLRSGMWVMGDNITVENCVLSLVDEAWRQTSCGLWVAGAKNFTLTDCTFTACGIAMAGPPISASSSAISPS